MTLPLELNIAHRERQYIFIETTVIIKQFLWKSNSKLNEANV